MPDRRSTACTVTIPADLRLTFCVFPHLVHDQTRKGQAQMEANDELPGAFFLFDAAEQEQKIIGDMLNMLRVSREIHGLNAASDDELMDIWRGMVAEEKEDAKKKIIDACAAREASFIPISTAE